MSDIYSSRPSCCCCSKIAMYSVRVSKHVLQHQCKANCRRYPPLWFGSTFTLHNHNNLTYTSCRCAMHPSLPKVLNALQFCWSPKDPKLCALVTDQGQLLLGLLGEPLQPVDTYSSVTCASWSPDGQLLAVASGQQVHIYNAQQRTACFDANIEHQVGVSTTATS